MAGAKTAKRSLAAGSRAAKTRHRSAHVMKSAYLAEIEPCVGLSQVDSAVSSAGTTYFNDMLGTTLCAKSKGGKYSAAALTAFGEGTDANKTFFSGKPCVAGLGHAFLFRNYRASLAKWQTANPLGYPDGWNALAYCGNGVTSAVDLWGGYWVYLNIFYFKKVDFVPFVVIPRGLPVSVNPTPPTIGSAIVS